MSRKLLKMNDLFNGFEFICAYIYDVLILTEVDWTNILQKLELSIDKLKGEGLKCNIEKVFLGQTKMEYLCFWVTHDGIKFINRNIESITNMKPPTYQKEVPKFIGLINYYQYIWPRRSHILAPLIKLTYIKNKCKWTKVKQDNFKKIF